MAPSPLPQIVRNIPLKCDSTGLLSVICPHLLLSANVFPYVLHLLSN